MATEPRRTGGLRGRRWVRAFALAGASAVAVASAAGQPPAPLPPGVTQPGAANPLPAAEQGKRVVAFVHGNVPITREELGEFLIARGGYDKLELLVNKRIIEIEAARRGITVTADEVQAGLDEDLVGIGVTREEFTRTILPKYGKTLYEWTADVVRPRLLLGKMCRDRVKVTDDELQRAFENHYGERREAQLVVWPKGANIPPLSAEVRATAAANPVEFDRLAAAQPDEPLRATQGKIHPVGRHIEGEDPAVVQALFGLKPGEITWVESQTKYTGIRCLRVIPPDAGVALDKVRATLEKDVFDRKLNAEIPKYFTWLKQQANPTQTIHAPMPQLPPGAPAPARAPDPDPRVLYLVYHNMRVTREDLGEFLIARGGYEKLELLVNKRIIEMEAARRGVTVTPQEIEATLVEDLKGVGLYRQTPDTTPEKAVQQMKDDFAKHVLPKRGLTMFEWTEDVLKPKLVLGKMCRDRVKVTDDDLKKAFEHHHGEKRAAKLIIWAKDEFRAAQKQWDEARKGDAQFDSVARQQRDPNLAAAAGSVQPVGRYGDAENPMVEQILFTLKEGEVSQLFETPAGIVCVKCIKILKPDGTVTMDRVRPALEKEVFEKKLAREIPVFFTELKKQANPNVLLKGPPSQRENEVGVQQLIQQAGGAPTAPPPPPPKK